MADRPAFVGIDYSPAATDDGTEDMPLFGCVTRQGRRHAEAEVRRAGRPDHLEQMQAWTARMTNQIRVARSSSVIDSLPEYKTPSTKSAEEPKIDHSKGFL
jgi:hypothetical protein